jgi:hypothetical protein
LRKAAGQGQVQEQEQRAVPNQDSPDRQVNPALDNQQPQMLEQAQVQVPAQVPAVPARVEAAR